MLLNFSRFDIENNANNYCSIKTICASVANCFMCVRGKYHLTSWLLCSVANFMMCIRCVLRASVVNKTSTNLCVHSAFAFRNSLFISRKSVENAEGSYVKRGERKILVGGWLFTCKVWRWNNKVSIVTYQGRMWKCQGITFHMQSMKVKQQSINRNMPRTSVKVSRYHLKSVKDV